MLWLISVLISDAFHAKLVVEDDRCYLTNGEQPWAENLSIDIFLNVLCPVFYGFLNLLLKGALNRYILTLTLVKARLMMSISAYL